MTGEHRARGDGRATDDGRGHRLYDRWSDHGVVYGSVMRLAAPLRRRAFEALAVAPGERLLDLVCGSGIDFASLRDAVGAGGEVIGVDYSEGMVRRATFATVAVREEFDFGAGYLAVARRAERGV